MRAEYDKIPANLRTKGVEAQQIVLRIAKPEFKAQVLEKANQIIERAKKDGGTISEEAFTELVPDMLTGQAEAVTAALEAVKAVKALRLAVDAQNTRLAAQDKEIAELRAELALAPRASQSDKTTISETDDPAAIDALKEKAKGSTGFNPWGDNGNS